MWWWMHEWGWGSWALMTVAMVAFWGLVAWTVSERVRSASRSSPTRESAEEILESRYAHGDIGTEEFEHQREVLRTTRR